MVRRCARLTGRLERLRSPCRPNRGQSDVGGPRPKRGRPQERGVSTNADIAQSRGSGRLTEIAAIGLSAIVLFAAFIWLAGLAGVEEPPERVGSPLPHGPSAPLAYS